MTNRAQRINQAIRRHGVTKMAVLAHELEVDESAISRWRKGGAMSLDNAARLCVYLDVSLDWLILARGAMIAHRDPSPTPDEYDLLLALRALPPLCTISLVQFLRSTIEHRVAPA